MPSVFLTAALLLTALAGVWTSQATLPTTPLTMRSFALRFDVAGTFTLEGAGWPSMDGTWTTSGNAVTLQNKSGPQSCGEPGKYTFAVDGGRVSLTVVDDNCQPRRMILDRSQWMPPGAVAPAATRTIVRSAGTAKTPMPAAAKAEGSWPSFRGHEAAGVSEGQNLPD